MDAFTAVADPTRRRILDELRRGDHTVTDLVTALRVNQPTVSKHLRVLREAHMVSSTIDAQRRRYRIDPEGLRAVDDWLGAFRRLWPERLDALEAHLDRRRR